MAISKHEAENATTHSRGSRLLAIAAIGLLSFVAALMISTRGRFRELLAELEFPPSSLTSFALAPLSPILLGAVAALTVAKEFVPRLAPAANFWNGCAICLALAALAVYLAAVFAPLMMLIESLS
jgi:hypothetical protein